MDLFIFSQQDVGLALIMREGFMFVQNGSVSILEMWWMLGWVPELLYHDRVMLRNCIFGLSP